jgi:hypothetical protein
MVGPMASDYRRSALHPVHRAFNAPRGKRTMGLLEMDSVVAGYVSVVLLLHLASRRIEERQLERNIERCRNTSRFTGSLAR